MANEVEDAADKKSEARTLMNFQRPLKGSSNGEVSAKGKGSTLNAYVRQSKGSKILY